MSQESRVTTFFDMVEYLLHYGGMDPQNSTVEDCRRAVLNGLREFTATHTWSFYNALGRISTVALYTTGTITYDDATLVVTLSGGTWPAWAAFGSIRISQIPYQVASVLSSQQLVLAKRTPIGADITTPTTFNLYRDTYPMPVDYRAGHDMIEYISGYVCSYVTNAAWMEAGRSWRGMQGKPVLFAITSDPHYLGAMACRFHPIPDNIYAFDFIYQRQPRYIVVTDYAVGNVTVTNGNATITGAGTNWLSKYAGSIIRFGNVGDKGPPTSLTGAFPYIYERTIVSVTDTGTIVLDEALPVDLAKAPYRISDPIDVEEGACMTAFHRECEKQMRLIRRMRPLFDGDTSETKEYTTAYLRAREADKRSLGTAVAGAGLGFRRRLADMPFLPNQS